MNVSGTLAGIPWQELEHAFGPATDLPEILGALSGSHGRKLRNAMSELCGRVLHQGTIYSASPPVVRELIPMSAKVNGQDRAVFYEVLTEFASSSRQAIHDGRAIPCCSGGDPEHGKAILGSLLDARDQFVADLGNAQPFLRRLAGSLLCCSAEAGSDSALLVRHQYEVESDAAVRLDFLDSLARVREHFDNWLAFLASALARETDGAIRFRLRYLQIREKKEEADESAGSELVATFVAATESEWGGDSGCFFQAVHWLGSARGLLALLQALRDCRNRDTILSIAEHVLRLVFQDQRTGWGSKSHSIVREGAAQPQTANEFHKSMMKSIVKMVLLMVLWRIFPSLLRRKVSKTKSQNEQRRHKIEYWGVKDKAPELPDHFTSDQARALVALAEKPEVWIDQTNLWSLFHLPDNAADLLTMLASH